MHPAALARTRASLEVFIAVLGSAAPGSEVVRLRGIIASRVPATPERSIFNSVLYECPDALPEAYDALAQGFVAAGVRAFTVWTFPGDERIAAFLHERGHRFDGEPASMLLDMDALRAASLDGFDWEETRDSAAVGAINDAAYGYAEPAFARALSSLDHPALHLYLARSGGEPVSCVMSCEVGGDCGIYCVATRHAARGRGFSYRLMSAALIEARRRGCVTASLQASTMGYPLYRKLGFEDVGRLALWEWRAGEPHHHSA